MSRGPRYPRHQVTPVVEWLLEGLGGRNVVACGSFRRGLLEVGDIDLVALGGRDLGPRLVGMGLVEVHGGWPRRAYELAVEWAEKPLRVDLWSPPARTAGAHVMFATGSTLHNQMMRRYALSRGIRITAEGVHDRRGSSLPCMTEDEVCESVGWPWVHPTRRSNPLEWAGALMEGI